MAGLEGLPTFVCERSELGGLEFLIQCPPCVPAEQAAVSNPRSTA